MRTIAKGSLPPSGWEFIGSSRTKIRQKSKAEKPVKQNINVDLAGDLADLFNKGLLKGEPGENGKDGRDGKDGKEFVGSRGPQGEKGQRGDRGGKGADGKNGKDGRQGEPGPIGPQGISGKDGSDGKDAPYIVEVKSSGNEVMLIMSEGEPFKFLVAGSSSTPFGGSGGAGNGTGGGSSFAEKVATNGAHPVWDELGGVVDNVNRDFVLPGTGTLVIESIRPLYRGGLETQFTVSGRTVTFGFSPQVASNGIGNEVVIEYVET